VAKEDSRPERGEKQYRSLVLPLPPEAWEVAKMAIHTAIATNRLELKPFASQKAEQVEAITRIFSEYLGEALPYLHSIQRDAFSGTEYSRNAGLALERDGYKCVLCQHSRANSGSVHVHHIVPRGYFGPERPQNINELSNLVTLCDHCHLSLHNPDPHSGYHWKQIAYRLKELIGEEWKWSGQKNNKPGNGRSEDVPSGGSGGSLSTGRSSS